MVRILLHSFVVISILAPPPQTPGELRIASIQVKGSGDVYDEDYEARYLREEIFPLKTSSGSRGSLAKRVDPATQTVDVRIVFN
jgi:hypothetical protein